MALLCLDVILRGIAQVACDILPLRVLPPIIFSALVYWQAGLHDHPDNFIIFGVVITLVSVWCVRYFGVRTFMCPRTAPQVNLISAAVCLSVGALVRDLCLANLAASLVLLFQLLLCGLLSHNASTGTTLSTFQRMSFMNYAFEILGNNEFIGAPHAVPRAAWALCSRAHPPVVAGETFNLSPTVPHHKVVPPVRAGPCAWCSGTLTDGCRHMHVCWGWAPVSRDRRGECWCCAEVVRGDQLLLHALNRIAMLWLADCRVDARASPWVLQGGHCRVVRVRCRVHCVRVCDLAVLRSRTALKCLAARRRLVGSGVSPNKCHNQLNFRSTCHSIITLTSQRGILHTDVRAGGHSPHADHRTQAASYAPCIELGCLVCTSCAPSPLASGQDAAISVPFRTKEVVLHDSFPQAKTRHRRRARDQCTTA